MIPADHPWRCTRLRKGSNIFQILPSRRHKEGGLTRLSGPVRVFCTIIRSSSLGCPTSFARLSCDRGDLDCAPVILPFDVDSFFGLVAVTLWVMLR
ncbi:hypothetical protein BDW72DRAFT_125656 [Aspergillus terricola var. indicus]